MSRIVNKDNYFDTGLDVLSELGFKHLNIGVLCRRLGVTSGSFYHHFGSWHAYVGALLDHWENRQVVILRMQRFDVSTPDTAIRALSELTLGLHHRAEAAIRAWAANDESVAVGVKRVDESRRRTVHKAITAVVGDTEKATVDTELGMAMLIGYQQMLAAGQPVSLEKLLGEYARLVYSHVRSSGTG